MNPCSVIQKSSYILERYLFPVSTTKLTTRFDAIEKTAESSQRPAGTNPHYDRINIMPHLFPNLRPGGALMRERICRIAKLIDVKPARDFFSESRGHVLVIFRMAARHI